MTTRIAIVLLGAAFIVLAASLVAAAAGYLARRDHATWSKAITRAATSFAAALSLAAVLVTALDTLIR